MEPAFPPSMLMFSHLPPVTSFGRLPGASALLCEEISLKKEPSSPTRRSPTGGYLHIKQEAEAAASGLHQQIREQLAREQEQQLRQQLAQEHREQLAQQRELRLREQQAREQLAQEQQAREHQAAQQREQHEQRAREQISLHEQQYRLYNAGPPQEAVNEGCIVQVTVGNHNIAQDLSLGKEGDENHALPFLPQLFSRTERNYGTELKQNTSAKKARRSNTDSQEVKTKRKQSSSSKLSLLGEVDSGSLSPNQKPHICEHCNAAFRSSYHLRRHVLIHTESY